MKSKKADMSWEQIIIWILLLAFLLFAILYVLGLDKIIKAAIDGILGLFG